MTIPHMKEEELFRFNFRSPEVLERFKDLMLKTTTDKMLSVRSTLVIQTSRPAPDLIQEAVDSGLVGGKDFTFEWTASNSLLAVHSKVKS